MENKTQEVRRQIIKSTLEKELDTEKTVKLSDKIADKFDRKGIYAETDKEIENSVDDIVNLLSAGRMNKAQAKEEILYLVRL